MIDNKKQLVTLTIWDKLSSMLCKFQLAPWENDSNMNRMKVIFTACMAKIETDESLIDRCLSEPGVSDFITKVLLEQIEG